MKTIVYIFMTSVLIAASAMAAPAPVKADKEKCQVEAIGTINDTGGDGSPVDVVNLKCNKKSVSALVFSQSQSMLLGMAKKQGKHVGVKFEKIDKKRLAIGEIDFK